MLTQILSQPKEPINRLYHLSDIHIPKSKNHQAYRNHFNRLYESLNTQEKGLIVVTGDIIDQKELNTEVIFLTQEFFFNLTKIMPVVVIPGNHDAFLQTHSRLDNLTGVLCRSGEQSLNQIKEQLSSQGWFLIGTNLYYLHATGIYYYNNLCLAVTSVFDYQIIPIKSIIKRNSTDLIIGLFHGSLYQAYGFGSYKVNDQSFTLSSFDGYDYVLLGDIHKHQFMGQGKRIGYAGSLLQNNFGESLNEHGYLKWFLEDAKKTKLIEIPSSVGYITVRIDQNNQVISKPIEEVIKSQAYYDKIYVRFILDHQANYQEALELSKIYNL